MLSKCVYKLYICLKHTYKKDLALNNQQWLIYNKNQTGARGVMVIVVGNGHGDTSSKPERD